nr:MAG TPA: hypothetical protein [Caudoviricetes sp.]
MPPSMAWRRCVRSRQRCVIRAACAMRLCRRRIQSAKRRRNFMVRMRCLVRHPAHRPFQQLPIGLPGSLKRFGTAGYFGAGVFQRLRQAFFKVEQAVLVFVGQQKLLHQHICQRTPCVCVCHVWICCGFWILHMRLV